MTNAISLDDFYIVTREQGSERSDLPVWATKNLNPLQLSSQPSTPVERQEVPNVPGAFQLLNVLSPEECHRILHTVNSLGFTEDAAVSLPRSVRHNSNLNWVVDDETAEMIWQRSKDHFIDRHNHFHGTRALRVKCSFSGIPL